MRQGRRMLTLRPRPCTRPFGRSAPDRGIRASRSHLQRAIRFPCLAVALGAVTLLVVGCAGSSTARGPRNLARDQVFSDDLSPNAPDIQTMDPDLVADTSSYAVIQLVYDNLVTLDQNLQVEDWAASRVDVSADGLVYTFHLRPGQAFSDGTPVTARDYAYGMDRAVNPCLASPTAYYLYAIKDAAALSGETCHAGAIAAAAGQTAPVITSLIGDAIRTPDDDTLVVTLAHPAAYFLEAMTYPVSDALDPAVVGADVASEQWTDALTAGPTGRGASGMYYLSVWDHARGKLVLKQNPHWWGLGQGKRPYLTEIDFSVFANPETAYAAYQTGQFDVAFPPPALLPQAKAQPGFHQVGSLNYLGLIFNWHKPPFDDLGARKAFCLAVNRDALAHGIFNDLEIPHWNIVPQGMPGYSPGVVGPDGVAATAGDPARAQADWQAYRAGHPGPLPPISVPYATIDSTAQRYAEALQSMWSQVLGVGVAVRGEDANAFVADLTAGNYVIATFFWQDDYPDPQDFLSLLFATTSTFNSEGASVPAADALMAAADQDANQVTRLRAYNQAEQLLIDAVATCPIAQGVTAYRVRDYVHDWIANASGGPSLDSWLATYITNH